MKIIIDQIAEIKIRQTARYIHQKFGTTVRSNFITEIKRIVKLLNVNPCLGVVERYLEGAPVLYRSIVIQRRDKIIYWINDEIIEIVDFWDCLREPENQAKRLM